MVAAPINHISLDERGVAYIHGTSMKVAYIAIDAEVWGMTPQQIRENYEQLSLAQIYAALAYYYDHKEEIDVQIAQWNEEYEQLRAQHPIEEISLDRQLEQRREQIAMLAMQQSITLPGKNDWLQTVGVIPEGSSLAHALEEGARIRRSEFSE